MSLVDDV